MDPPEFLTSALNQSSEIFHITLTFAQSLDGKIAGKNGQQLILSGRESMIMTHWMRTLHDAILVGVGTALNDDPQLNTRHLPPRSSPYHLPRPVILDTTLRLKSTCKLLVNYQTGVGRRPWVFCKSDSEPTLLDRRRILEAAGAKVIPTATSPDGSLSLPAILESLANLKIKSLMVEGGAHIIQSFLRLGNVETIVVTTAPKTVGEDGLGHGTDLENIRNFTLEHTEKVGADTVVFWRRKNRTETE